MLPSAHRLRASGDFTLIQRRGTRITRPTLILSALSRPDTPTRMGMSVGKSVGNSVVRHSVSRKLRHVTAPHITELPMGTQLVIRALPAAAGASSAQLHADLNEALSELGRRGIKS
ncbi:MAG: ribonuclease P protein component [Candidatus Nanopelagicales bacterium]